MPRYDVFLEGRAESSTRYFAVSVMTDGAECKCGNCGRHETFTSFDRHTDHAYCCRCGYKMEGLTNE